MLFFHEVVSFYYNFSTYKKNKKCLWDDISFENGDLETCQRALAQLATPPLASARWRVRSWVEDSLGMCNIPIQKKKKKKRNSDLETCPIPLCCHPIIMLLQN